MFFSTEVPSDSCPCSGVNETGSEYSGKLNVPPFGIPDDGVLDGVEFVAALDPHPVAASTAAAAATSGSSRIPRLTNVLNGPPCVGVPIAPPRCSNLGRRAGGKVGT